MAERRFEPPRPPSAVDHAGTYRRVLPVGLADLYENVLDFEHLPHLHAASFTAVRAADFGAWGWRAEVIDAVGRASMVEVSLDRGGRRWVTRVLRGHRAGSEVRTRAAPRGPRRVEVVVEFFLPGVDRAERREAGEACARYFSRLYDEDVAMMTERRRQLDRRLVRSPEPERALDLGPRSALTLPRQVVLGGREFVVVEVEGRLAAFPCQCPHWLAPLSADRVQGHVVACPWHGDRFDVHTGENLSGRPCPLSHLPEITVTADDRIVLRATH